MRRLRPMQQAIHDRHVWYVETAKAMTPQDRAELEAWEKAHINGHSVGTSDWPGWRRFEQ